MFFIITVSVAVVTVVVGVVIGEGCIAIGGIGLKVGMIDMEKSSSSHDMIPLFLNLL